MMRNNMLTPTLRLLGALICQLGSVGLAIAQTPEPVSVSAANATVLSEAIF